MLWGTRPRVKPTKVLLNENKKALAAKRRACLRSTGPSGKNVWMRKILRPYKALANTPSHGDNSIVKLRGCVALHRIFVPSVKLRKKKKKMVVNRKIWSCGRDVINQLL